MKNFLGCIPCFLKQSLEAVHMTIDGQVIHTQDIKEQSNAMAELATTGNVIDFATANHFNVNDVLEELVSRKKQITYVVRANATVCDAKIAEVVNLF